MNTQAPVKPNNTKPKEVAKPAPTLAKVPELRARMPITLELSKTFNDQQWLVLTRDIFPKANNQNTIAFAYAVAQVNGLDLFRKHIEVVDFGGGEQPYISVHGLIALAEKAGEFGGWGQETFGPIKTFTIGKEQITASEWVHTEVYKIIKLNGKEERVLCNGPMVFFEEEARTKKDGSLNSFWRDRPRSMLSKNSRRRTLLANFQSLSKSIKQVHTDVEFRASVSNENVIDLPYSEPLDIDTETGEVLEGDFVHEEL